MNLLVEVRVLQMIGAFRTDVIGILAGKWKLKMLQSSRMIIKKLFLLTLVPVTFSNLSFVVSSILENILNLSRLLFDKQRRHISSKYAVSSIVLI